MNQTTSKSINIWTMTHCFVILLITTAPQSQTTEMWWKCWLSAAHFHCLKRKWINATWSLQFTPRDKLVTFTLGVTISIIWFILENNECTGHLSNSKRPETPQKTTKEENSFLGQEKPLLTKSRRISRRQVYGGLQARDFFNGNASQLCAYW